MTKKSGSVGREKSKDLLVSVIIPVYQVSDYVERCLQSVINQTYQSIECIIVDDCSTDDSLAKCERLISAYDGPIKFHILHHERNRGLSAARNTGTDAASGEYLYYLDSDDEITPYCIEKLVSYVQNDDSIEMVQGMCLRKENDKEKLWKCGEVRLFNNNEVRKQYHFGGINGAVWNKLVKRSFIIDNQLYNREGLINEDLLWSFYLVKHLNNAQLCNTITYYYLIRPDSILKGSSLKRKGLSYVQIFDEILQNLTPGWERDELKRYSRTFCMVLAKYFRCVPELKPILKKYKMLVKKYDCWPDYLTVSSVAFVSRFCNPLGILEKLDYLRLKAKGNL